MTSQRKGVEDFSLPSSLEVFNQLSDVDHSNLLYPSEDVFNGETKETPSSSTAPRRWRRSRKGENMQVEKEDGEGAEPWFKVEEEGRGSQRKHEKNSAKRQLPHEKSAAAVGGLRPSRIYVINDDRDIERWVAFKARWTIVMQLSQRKRSQSGLRAPWDRAAELGHPCTGLAGQGESR